MPTCRRTKWFALGLFVALLAGCAAFGPPSFVRSLQRPGDAVHFFAVLDKAVETYDLRDGADATINGFPYLRINRFIEALKDPTAGRRDKLLLVEKMQQLDLKARKKEIENLPPAAIEDMSVQLNGAAGKDPLFAQTAIHSDALLGHDLQQAGFFDALFSLAVYPAEYVTAMRVAGLYPLASIPVMLLTHKVRAEFKRWFDLPYEKLPVDGKLTRFESGAGGELTAREKEAILGKARTPYGWYTLSAADERRLFASFAPVFVQDIVADYDRIGQMIWQDGRPAVDTARPTVYYYSTHALVGDTPLLQLNYVVWYAARNGPNSPWIEKGAIDGLTVRVSLDERARPLMVDIMNNCGCYHLFAPRRERIRRVKNFPFRLDPFVPQWMPDDFPEQPLAVRINSGWHQVQRLLPAQRSNAAVYTYALRPYDDLETLPQSETISQSIFTPKGIVKGSGRIEPLLLFPMGIPDVGSMRQRGHHALKLVGREYFEDPRLFENNFVLD